MSHQTRLKPMGERIVVLLDSRKAVSDGGIVIPERAQTPEEWGLAFLTGPNCQHVIPGDRVYVPPHLGTHYVEDGQDYIIIEEFRVLAREQRVYSNAAGQDFHVTGISQTEEIEPGKIVDFAPADQVAHRAPVKDCSAPLGTGQTFIQGCSACGESHAMKFEALTEPEVIEGIPYDFKAICQTTEKPVFAKEEPTAIDL